MVQLNPVSSLRGNWTVGPSAHLHKSLKELTPLLLRSHSETSVNALTTQFDTNMPHRSFRFRIMYSLPQSKRAKTLAITAHSWEPGANVAWPELLCQTVKIYLKHWLIWNLLMSPLAFNYPQAKSALGGGPECECHRFLWLRSHQYHLTFSV